MTDGALRAAKRIHHALRSGPFDVDSAAATIDRETASRELYEVLFSLANEARGFLALAREAHEIFGWTNIHCMERRIQQADVALAKARGEA